jgi:hypothetical protein
MTQVAHRKLWEIAQEIGAENKNIGKCWIFSPAGNHARPYWSAMQDLAYITDMYLNDTAESVVLYFLSNASTWRGETAKRIKAELKAMLPKR